MEIDGMELVVFGVHTILGKYLVAIDIKILEFNVA
jgi:hypothetical protein